MGLFKTAAKVAVASSVHGRVQRRQQQKWAAQNPVPQAPPLPAPVAAPPAAAPAAPAAAEYGRPPFVTEHTVAGPPSGAAVPAARPPAARVDMATKIAQLQQLGDLQAAGVLTDAEFEGQKAAVLSQ